MIEIIDWIGIGRIEVMYVPRPISAIGQIRNGRTICVIKTKMDIIAPMEILYFFLDTKNILRLKKNPRISHTCARINKRSTSNGNDIFISKGLNLYH
jgi:hypothetical protein